MTDVLRAEGVRCSDADRERTSARLRDAAAAGYLTMDEMDERLTAAYAARFGHELDVLVSDLPRAKAFGGTTWPAVVATLWARLVVLVAGRKRRRLVIAAVVALAVLAVAAGVLEGFDLFEGAEGSEGTEGSEGPEDDD